MAQRTLERDTDADWRELGNTQPYWGVLSAPHYRTENLTADGVDEFYASGRDFIADIVERLQKTTGARPGGRALDFGCGAGRLAEAMTAHAREVIGYDIAPGMLAEARKRGVATYVDALPDGPFDWINSFIVLQHIPPRRGLELIGLLLERVAAGGFLSLHLTVWREPHLDPSKAVRRGWRKLVPPPLRLNRPGSPPRGAITMYDYDLSAVVRLLQEAGFDEVSLVATDHGGHHGFIILGRKAGTPIHA